MGLVCIYFAVACVTTLGRLGRDGANYNHLLDLLLPACLLVGSSLGLAYSELRKRDQGSGARGQLAVAAFVVAWGLLLAQVFTMNDPVSWYRGTWPNAADDTQMRLISNLIAQTKGDIYSEDAYLLLANGRKVTYDDAFMFNALTKAGRWDDFVYNKKLSDRSFALILLEHGLGRFTQTGREIFDSNYNLLYEDIRDSYVPAR